MATTTRPARAALLLAVSLLCCVATTAGRADALSAAYRYLIIDADSDAALAAAVAGLSWSASARDPGNCDLIVESLVRNTTRQASWNSAGLQILRVLPGCPDPARYLTAVTSAWRSVHGKEAFAYYQRFRDVAKQAATESYQAGSIDIDALRAAQRRSALVEPTLEQAQRFAELTSSLTIDELYARAGPPTHVMTHGVKIGDNYSVDLRQLWFLYRGIGRVVFAFQHESGWHWQDFVLDPLQFEDLMPYRAYAAELGQPDDNALAMIQLLSGNPYAIKESAKRQYKADAPSGEYLDTAAQLLLERHKSVANPVDSEAYSWLCNVLSDRGGPRYATVLQTVAHEATDEKLVRFAKRKIKSSPGEHATRYVPGSISLADEARKYPPLYPQLTSAATK